jgi:hypothetical protein
MKLSSMCLLAWMLSGTANYAHAQIVLRSSVFGTGAEGTRGNNLFLAGTVGQSIAGNISGSANAAIGFWLQRARLTTLAVEGTDPAATRSMTITGPMPNPFSSSSVCRIETAKPGWMRIMLYNVLGQPVLSLLNEELPAGIVPVTIRSEGLERGVYFLDALFSQTEHATKIIIVQ